MNKLHLEAEEVGVDMEDRGRDGIYKYKHSFHVSVLLRVRLSVSKGNEDKPADEA